MNRSWLVPVTASMLNTSWFLKAKCLEVRSSTFSFKINTYKACVQDSDNILNYSFPTRIALFSHSETIDKCNNLAYDYYICNKKYYFFKCKKCVPHKECRSDLHQPRFWQVPYKPCHLIWLWLNFIFCFVFCCLYICLIYVKEGVGVYFYIIYLCTKCSSHIYVYISLGFPHFVCTYILEAARKVPFKRIINCLYVIDV